MVNQWSKSYWDTRNNEKSVQLTRAVMMRMRAVFDSPTTPTKERIVIPVCTIRTRKLKVPI